MDLFERLAAAAQNWNFSILGGVYLGPGHFLRLPPLEFLAVLVGGIFWVGLAGLAAWLLFRPRFVAAARKGDGTAARIIFSSFVFVYMLLGAYTTFSYPPTTDEPHYLALAESLVSGGGVEVSGVYARKDFTKFYPSDTIDPHTVITPDGKMYSQHTIGLPALLVPGYAVAGRWGTTFTTAIITALLVALLFLLGRKAGNGLKESARAAILTGATAPVLFASGTVFTEGAAAVLSAFSLLALGKGWVAPVCGALLPWLHPRYAFIALGLAVLDLYASKTRILALNRWLVSGIASGAGFLYAYHGPALVAILNVLTEKYPSRLEDLTAVNLAAVTFANPVSGALAKLIDRDFGWFPFSPWALAIIPGIAVAVRSRKFPHRWFLWGAGGYFFLTCLFRNWGGSTYPGRTLLPVLPFIIGYLGAGLGWTGKRKTRTNVMAVLIAISLAVSWMLTAVPVLRYVSGRTWMAEKTGLAWLAFPASWFPSFMSTVPVLLWTLPWAVIALLIWKIPGSRGRT